MDPITLLSVFGMSRINNAEHSEFHAAVHTYLTAATAEAINCTQANLDEYKAAQQAEEELIGRQTANIITADIEAADHERDLLFVYMFSQIDSIAKSPVPAQREAGRQLKLIIKPFRGGDKSPLAQETTEIRSLLSHLKASELAPQLALIPALTDTMAALEVANEKVATLMSQRTASEQEKAETLQKRAVTERCYHYIEQHINATLILQPTPAVQQLVTELNNLIHHTRNVYNIRMGVMHAHSQKAAKHNQPTEN